MSNVLNYKRLTIPKKRRKRCLEYHRYHRNSREMKNLGLIELTKKGYRRKN
jgi:hypothetical protein